MGLEARLIFMIWVIFIQPLIVVVMTLVWLKNEGSFSSKKTKTMEESISQETGF